LTASLRDNLTFLRNLEKVLWETNRSKTEKGNGFYFSIYCAEFAYLQLTWIENKSALHRMNNHKTISNLEQLWLKPTQQGGER
jgi:hypothetical protein